MGKVKIFSGLTGLVGWGMLGVGVSMKETDWEEWMKDPYLPAGFQDNIEWVRLGWNMALLRKDHGLLTLMEAWKKVPLKQTIGIEDAFAHGFSSGREGMIPAENAIVVPDVGEWPEWAIGMHLCFCETGEWDDTSLKDREWKHYGKLMPSDVWVDRPVPAFVPGWYWVKWFPNGEWETAQYNGKEFQCRTMRGSPSTTGPKIEEPEE